MAINELDSALDTIKGESASLLGSGWDLSAQEIKVAILIEMTRFDEAQDVLNQLQTRWPKDEEIRVNVMLQVANIQLIEGLFSEAASTANLAKNTTSDPMFIHTFGLLGRV